MNRPSCPRRLRFVLVLAAVLAGNHGAAFGRDARAAGSADAGGLTTVREIDRSTPLVIRGRPPALLLPSDSAYAEAASLLTDGLAALGIRADRVSGIVEADPAQRTVVCLGSMVDNPLIERLYWNRYTFVDALMPGAGQFLIHAVYDPYPFNGGHNVIIIGCHDSTGATLGVKRFLSLVADGRLPYVVEAGPQAPVSEIEGRKLLTAKLEPSFLEFMRNANRYLQTGAEAHARKAIAAMEVMAQLYGPGGQRSGGTTLTYERLPFDEEMASWEINCAWDAFEECPLISDAQRLAFSNVMLRFTRELVRYCSDYRSIDERYTVSWNHTTFPLLGIHFGARYFERYYQLKDTPEMLARARMCFVGQARSWKPQEDADLYMTLTTEHAYIYCMAENRMDGSVVANLKRTADYVVGWCDNLGRSSGFGDATIISTTRFLGDRLLPLALWWSRDGGYRWLMERFTGNKWRDAYERGVQPTRPDRFTGVNIFPMDPQVYALTQTRPSYNEPVKRADVPPAEAFDKITFRENWETNGQYLILDGLARGKHLHYDGNSILEFVEGGERWLLAHDYLTRNTTEHSMLSILRNHRCDQLVPGLAGLAAAADLASFGYTRTYLKDYNGCDWQRQILWRKGGWFLVADTVTPRTAGDYTFDLTWKTIDSGGNQHVNRRGDFTASRGVGDEQSRNCSVLDDSTASGGKVLQLNGNDARIAFGVTLPAGDYALTVIGEGRPTDPGVDRHEDLRISADLGVEEVFGLSSGHASSAAGQRRAGAPPPRIVLRGAGPHLLVVTPVGHRSPMRIDRFVFENMAGKSETYEAENLPSAPPSRQDLSRQLRIRPVNAVTSWVSNHEREGIPIPVSLLHQRQQGEFRAGQNIRFASLMFASRPGARRNLEPGHVAENLVFIQGSDPGLALLGRVNHSGLVAVVEAGWLTAQTVVLCGLREFRAGELAIESTAAVDVELDLGTGTAKVQAPPAGAQIRLELEGRQQTLRLAGGSHEVLVNDFRVPARAVQLINALIPAGPATEEKTGTGRGEVSRPTWMSFDSDGQIAAVKQADLGDGEGERLFVCRDNTVQCLSPDGRWQWSFTAAGRVSDVAFGELRSNPGKEILVGSSDTYVYLLSAQGKLLERHQMRGVQYARSSGNNPYGVYNVGIWDLDGDGANKIVATLSSYDVQVLTPDWRLLWNQHHALHGSMQLSFEDLDGDGRPDTLLVGDRYGNCVGISPAGRLAYRGATSIGDVAYVVTSLDRGRTRHIVSGSSAGDLMATSASGAAKPLWRFDNYGYPVNRLRAADLTGDGWNEIIVASGTGYLYVLDQAGKVMWQDRAGYCVNDALVISGSSGMRVVYCDESGVVRVADSRGRIIHEFLPPAPARSLAVLSTASRPLLVMALADGRLAAYDLQSLPGVPAGSTAGPGRGAAR